MLAPLWARALASPETPESTPAPPSVAFYYGEQPPLDALQSFDWMVIDGTAQLPPKVSDIGPGYPGPTYFGYVSIGEFSPKQTAKSPPPTKCSLGQNPVWKTSILDLRQAACRDWLVSQEVAPMLERGFSHFFLDTLDSNERVLSATADRQAYNQGIVALIQAIRQRSPRATFMLNRGFGLLDQAKSLGVVAIAAESLYSGWDESTQQYIDVKPADTTWLRGQLDAVKARGLVPISIDYLPDGKAPQARQLADRIARDGFVPYITNGALNRVGTGSIDPQPRQVLMLYDGDTSPMETQVNFYVAALLNYMGYATHAINVDSEELPSTPMEGRIAGVVTWFSSGTIKNPEPVYQWLRKQMASRIPVAIFGRFGFASDQAHLAPLGLAPGERMDSSESVNIVSQDPDLVGFETKPRPQFDSFFALSANNAKVGLTLKRGSQTEAAVALTSWGGYALSPYVINYLPQGTVQKNQDQKQWILNPFNFLREALHLKPQPAFTTTTLSGNRLFFAHFDGDGFASLSYDPKYHGKTAASVILEAILERFHLPVAASVIAGEFIPDGLYDAAHRAEYTPIARAIFALPWVEIGSHTYSHPFDWGALEHDPSLSAGLHLSSGQKPGGADAYTAVAGLKYGYNLAIPGYRFDAKTEVDGSADFINQHLAPPGKKTVLYQWSGDTDPDAEVLGLTYKAGLLNINGSNSTIDKQWPSLTNLAPLGVWKEQWFQVFAPDANEDQFTDDWKPPYCGYRKVIQTFQMTETPRRLLPINLYYHFYSGARPCGLAALTSVYEWVMTQRTTPVFPTHYARMALGFEYAAIARNGDAWVLGGYGADQTVRIGKSEGYPDLKRSSNIVGYNDTANSRYITLGPGGHARLVLKSQPSQEPYLVSANAPITAFSREYGHMSIQLAGYVPLKIVLGNVGAAGCHFQWAGKEVSASPHDHQRVISASASSGTLDVACPAP